MNKKASLNLSIQAIVIVVIAFVVLGLGLGFVKGTFKELTSTSGEVQAKIKEQVLEDLRTSGKKLSISQEIQLERGKQTVENVGIVNTGFAENKFGIQVQPINKQGPNGEPVQGDAWKQEVTFFYNTLIEKQLAPTQGDVIPITITAKSSASGNYLFKVNVYEESAGGDCSNLDSESCNLYDTRSFFVRVS